MPNEMRRRTDLLRERIAEELERRRVWLDAELDLRSIRIDIKLRKDNGMPRVVIVSTESESDA